MITFENLSKRIFQFFDSIYGIERESFGFSSNVNESFREEQTNQDIRPNVETLLFYRIEDEMAGNGIQSNSIEYSETGEEIILAVKNIEVVVNILSKTYKAKDAVNFFNFAIQSQRKDNACYDKTKEFDLILTSKSQPIVLTELEKGAWAERIEQRLMFKYTDSLELDVVQNLQEIEFFEDVKDTIIINSEIKES